MIKTLQLTPLTLLTLVICSCSGDQTDAPAQPQTETITFATGMNPIGSDDPDSRASVIEKEDLEAFRVYGAQYEGTDQWSPTFSFYTIPGDIVRPAKDGSWTTATPYYWPDKSRTMRFFGYAPVDIDGWVYTNPEKSPEEARFFYTVPTDPKQQTDILCSSLTQRINHSASPNEKVQLWFHHALTQITFKIEGTERTGIESITLSGLTGCGGYHPTPGDGWWDLYDYTQTDEGFRTAYTVYFPADGSIGDDQRLMVIPQTTPYGSKLEIRFRDGRYESRDFSYKTFNLGAVANIVINL